MKEIFEVFYPSKIKCIVCDDDIPENSKYPICGKCKLSYNLKFCLRCGRSMEAEGQYCTWCKSSSWFFESARAPFIYKDNVKRLIHKLKYGNGRYIAKEIAPYMADSYYEHSIMSDIITSVPMHLKKRKKRGYNQAEELAGHLSERLGIENISVLEKTVIGKSLARQSASERKESIKDTISLTPSVNVKGKKILLIDDVFTTGSTANECARVLMKAKAEKVNVLTFATAKQKELTIQTLDFV